MIESNFKNRFLKIVENRHNNNFIIDVESNTHHSYEDFYRDCIHVSSFLSKKYHSQSVVVMYGRNSYLYAVYVVAAVLSGKTILTLNPDEISEITENIIKNINRELIIFSDTPVKISNHQSVEMIIENETKSLNEIIPCGPSMDQDLFYMPTSATTGESKLVVQKEKALLANIDDLISHHNLYERKTIATPLPLFHVNALHFSLFCTLFSGGTLVLLKTFDPKKCLEVIEKFKVDLLSVIPSILNSFVRNHQSLKNLNLQNLKYFVSAAAPLSVETVKSIYQLYNKKIIQGYGLSEGVNFSCTLPIDLSDEDYVALMCTQKFPSVGIALANNKVKILDENFLENSDNVEGEIAISGKNLMSGYLNSLNENDFFGKEFLTGDLGFSQNYKGQKYFFVSGRKKETAKIMGESVSLREIDELLSTGFVIDLDYYSVSFMNEFRGEELAVVCKIDSHEKCDFLFNVFKKEILKIPMSRRPKVILFVINQNIRTPSGKARRNSFKDSFAEFAGTRFLNQTLYKII